jgi:excisionase family DNA binding protein
MAGVVEHDALLAIEQLVADAADARLCLVEEGGRAVSLPPAVRGLLAAAVPLLVRDRGLLIAALQAQLTTQEAADLLGISRPHLVKLLDEGAMPSSRPGVHRRVALPDVLAYQARVRGERLAGLRRVVAAGEDLEPDESDR